MQKCPSQFPRTKTTSCGSLLLLTKSKNTDLNVLLFADELVTEHTDDLLQVKICILLFGV